MSTDHITDDKDTLRFRQKLIELVLETTVPADIVCIELMGALSSVATHSEALTPEQAGSKVKLMMEEYSMMQTATELNPFLMVSNPLDA